MDTLSSKTIKNLRLPLAIMVVFIHSFGTPWSYSINWMSLDSIDVFNIVRVFFSHVLSQVAVPTFFLISGYLFFIKADKIDFQFYKKQWQKRIYTLFIPYVLWNIICLLWNTLFKVYVITRTGSHFSELEAYFSEVLTWHVFWDFNSWEGGRTTLLGQITDPDTGPISIPLWFLRDLMSAVALAPLLMWLLKKTHGLVLGLLAVLYLLKIDIGIPSMLITSMLFFSTGSWLAIKRKSLADVFEKHRIVSTFCWVVLMAFCVYYDGTRTDTGLLFFTPMVLFGVAAIIGQTSAYTKNRIVENETQKGIFGRIINYASENTFFIYVSHALWSLSFALSIADILSSLLGGSGFAMIIKYFATPFMTMTFTLVSLYLMNKIMPRTTKVLSGQR